MKGGSVDWYLKKVMEFFDFLKNIVTENTKKQQIRIL